MFIVCDQAQENWPQLSAKSILSLQCRYITTSYTLLLTQKQLVIARRPGILFQTVDFWTSISSSHTRLLIDLSFVQQCDMGPCGYVSTFQPLQVFPLGVVYSNSPPTPTTPPSFTSPPLLPPTPTLICDNLKKILGKTKYSQQLSNYQVYFNLVEGNALYTQLAGCQLASCQLVWLLYMRGG